MILKSLRSGCGGSPAGPDRTRNFGQILVSYMIVAEMKKIEGRRSASLQL
jgi:hypothetical protein